MLKLNYFYQESHIIFELICHLSFSHSTAHLKRKYNFTTMQSKHEWL